jgi:hypothetical protein
MSEKKIAECVKVLINLGNYQNIEIAKYAEKVITYETEEEMIKKEDELTVELTNNMFRNMKKIPDQLGKKTEAPKDVEDRIKKIIPEWLTAAPVPNLANSAKKMQIESEGKQKTASDENKEWTIETITETPVAKPQEEVKPTPEVKIEENDTKQDNTKQDNDMDLFGADEDLFK